MLIPILPSTLAHPSKKACWKSAVLDHIAVPNTVQRNNAQVVAWLIWGSIEAIAHSKWPFQWTTGELRLPAALSQYHRNFNVKYANTNQSPYSSLLTKKRVSVAMWLWDCNILHLFPQYIRFIIANFLSRVCFPILVAAFLNRLIIHILGPPCNSDVLSWSGSVLWPVHQ
jgi:hypothetical protein